MTWNKKWAAARKIKIQYRLDAGLCPRCGAETNGHRLCDRCQERTNERQRTIRLNLKENNLCRECGKVEVEDGQYYCDECNEKFHGRRVGTDNSKRICKADGCDNIASRNRLYCGECLAKLNTCDVYFKKCNNCGKLFTARWKNILYCNDECFKFHRRESGLARPINRTCVVCKKEYIFERGKNFDSYCSTSCRNVIKKIRRRESKRRRKARMKTTIISIFRDVDIFIRDRDRYRCHLCGKKLNRKNRVPHPMAPTIDHIIPISCGGTHTRRNVKCACFKCNAKKGNRTTTHGEQMLLIGI